MRKIVIITLATALAARQWRERMAQRTHLLSLVFNKTAPPRRKIAELRGGPPTSRAIKTQASAATQRIATRAASAAILREGETQQGRAIE
jgi:hypothetical protein